MKIAIAFTLGVWFGYFICALMVVNKNNPYENTKGYEEVPIDKKT